MIRNVKEWFGMKRNECERSWTFTNNERSGTFTNLPMNVQIRKFWIASILRKTDLYFSLKNRSNSQISTYIYQKYLILFHYNLKNCFYRFRLFISAALIFSFGYKCPTLLIAIFRFCWISMVLVQNL